MKSEQNSTNRLEELRELLPLLPYLKHHKSRVMIGFVFVIVTNFFALLGPRVLQHAIDSLEKDISSKLLLAFAGLILGVSIMEGIFRYAMRQTIIVVSRLIEYELRNDYFRHLQSMARSFFNRYSTGDLMARATNDLNSVRAVMGPGIMYSVNTFVVGIGAIVLMLLLNVKLTIISVLTFPIMSYIVKRAMGRIHRLFGQIQEQFSNITARVQENLSGIRVIKSYQREQFEIDSFSQLNREFVDKNISLGKTEGLLWSSMRFFTGVGVLLLLWVGGIEVINGRLTKGEFVAFFSYLGLLTWPIISLGWVINVVQQGTASMRRINKVMSEEPDIRDHEHTRHDIKRLQGEIELRNVSFGYHENQRVLRNINLKIRAGMTVAVVGHTGSGKSTLIGLITRMFDPTEGQILIDGVDLRNIPLSVLHSDIGVVPQETFLFSDTIHENIVFGLENGNGESMRSAANIARIDQEIEGFQKGYDTLLGERGINLSGGQKQRVAIARAIVRQPSILILDDSLSAVDTYTEEEILRGLRGVMRERTSLLISHRISTVKDADLIIVLKDGRIVERGTHDLLLQKDGHYAELYKMQQLEEDLEAI